MQVTPRVDQVVRRAEEVRTPGEPFADVQRLLVVRHDRLGDLVLSLPAVDALRRTYPDAELGLVVRADLIPLARMVGGVDRILGADADRGGLRRQIEDFGADLIVCVSRGAGISRVAAGARVRRRVGTGYRIYSPLFTRRVAERRRSGNRHEAEYALSFAHRAGAAGGPAVFPLRVEPDTERGARAWRQSHAVRGNYVVLHPGSGGSCPRWPLRRFIELAARLLALGARVVFTIGPEDHWCDEVLDAARARVREIPRYSGGLERLPALLRDAALVVSNSTGPLHLAAALGTPTLGVYAPWSSCSLKRWGPYAGNGWAVSASNVEACSWSRRERRSLGEQLLAAVPAEFVAHAAEAILARRDPQG